MKNLLFTAVLWLITYHYSAGQAEVPLNLHMAVTNFSDYLQGAKMFQNRFTGLHRFHFKQRERVKYSSIVHVKSTMHGSHEPEYISGLRIYYGLTLQNKIILYYIPVFANRIQNGGLEATFEVTEPEGGFEAVFQDSNYDIFYTHNGELLNLREDGIEMEEAPYNINRYRFNVRTVQGYEIEEVYSVFLPFQEIDALFEDNRYTEFNTGNIYFTSVAVQNQGRYRHDLIMTTIINYHEPFESNIDFKGMAANMAFKCPHNCNVVSYPVMQ